MELENLVWVVTPSLDSLYDFDYTLYLFSHIIRTVMSVHRVVVKIKYRDQIYIKALSSLNHNNFTGIITTQL